MPRPHPIILLTLTACLVDPAAPEPIPWSPAEVAPSPPAIIPWIYDPPKLNVSEPIIGQITTMTVSNVPEGSEVSFLLGNTGLGDGPCDLIGTICTAVLEPTVLAVVVADAAGIATFDLDVPEDQDPRPIYLQALVYEPVASTAGKSDKMQRQYTVPAADAAAAFTEVTDAVGMTTTYTWSNTHTGGAAWVDYNNDFWPDLFITNGGGEPHYLYRNEGDGTFVDVSDLVPKPDLAIEDAGVKFADLENDGDSDIVVIVDNPERMVAADHNERYGGPNLLYINQGDGTFVETGLSAGLVDPDGRRNSCGALADYDLDGFVDAYLGMWAMNDGEYDKWDRLLRGNGDGTFEEVESTVVDGSGRDALTAIWYDPNQDGWPDLYVGNVSWNGVPPDVIHDDLLYRNDGGTFTEIIDLSPDLGDDARAAMGIDVGDIDNDGDWDLYITDSWGKAPEPTGGVLYEGNPDGTLSDNTCDVAGICTGYSTWPVNFADFDRDGWIDVRIGTTLRSAPDLLFMNNGDGTFASHHVPVFTDNEAQGGAQADYDGDGDVDVFTQSTFQDSLLYRNEGIDDNNWLEVKLIGTVSNRDAIGAEATLSAGGLDQLRRVSGGDSAHSQSDLIMHWGLGTEEEATVEIRWPSGIIQTIGPVAANQLVFVDETDGLLTEDLVSASAAWDAGTLELTVTAVSSFGGRTELAATDYGDLDYDAAPTHFSAVFAGVVARPELVTITSSRGGAWQVRTGGGLLDAPAPFSTVPTRARPPVGP